MAINLINKGINIDDVSAGFPPAIPNWPCTSNTPQMFRTFHYAATNTVHAEPWVTYCVKNNLPVMVGLELSDDDIGSFSADYQKSKAEYDANVIAIGIGNEQSDANSIKDRLKHAHDLKANGNLPKNALITTVLSLDVQWFSNNGKTYPPADTTFSDSFRIFSSLLDVVAFNCYGGYPTYGNPNPPFNVVNSTSWTTTEGSILLNQFGAIRFAMQAANITTPFWCTETGWSSLPSSDWNSISNLSTFYKNFLQFPSTPFTPQGAPSTVNPPDKIFYFSMRDANNEGFGLYTNSQTFSSKISC